MVASKGIGGGSNVGSDGIGVTKLIQPISSECCMCGDVGISEMLFRCKICKFRSQHKYCSNQYPNDKACNWCLTQKHDSSGNTSKSTSSCIDSSSDGRRDHAVKNRRNPNSKTGRGGLKARGKAVDQIKVITNTAPMTKLHGSSPVSSCRKRAGGCVVGEEKNHVVVRKSKSENHISNGGGAGIKQRPVVRHKARKYRLLEEISSQ